MDKSSTHSQKMELWRACLARSAEYCRSDEEYCKAEGISIHTLRYWKYKFKQESKNQELTIQPFAKVQIEQSLFEMQASRAFPDPRWLAQLIVHLHKGMRL